MKLIISPAKKMRVNTDSLAAGQLPRYLEEAETLKLWIQSLSYAEQKALWGCNDKIAVENAARFAAMNLREGGTPAILAYEGIQYQYMAPAVFEEKALRYVEEKLCILSGFYGVLRPMDAVTPYRLELQAKAAVAGHKNLYAFWEISCTAPCGMRALSSSISPRRSIRRRSRRIYSRRIAILPVCSENF